MPRQWKRFRIPFAVIPALLFSILSPISITQAIAAPALVTCINLDSGKERISKTVGCIASREAQANWRKSQSNSPIDSGYSAKVISTCSNKEGSLYTYQIIRKSCARHQMTTAYSRSGALPAKPAIKQVVSNSDNSSQISLVQSTVTNPDAPIAFYTVSSSKGNTQRIYSWKDLSLVISGLQAQTTYTFTVSATTADGTSPVSAESIPVTTPAYVPPTPAPTVSSLVAPAFTLTFAAETRTVNTAATGFTINSTGGAIASFAITATPPGMSFNNTTGALTGTPNTVASATSYTVTATNASGSATRTFTLIVKVSCANGGACAIGDRGPGGGTVFYYSAAGFNCGPGNTNTGSPTGSKCNYLEAAPTTGSNAWVDIRYGWSATINAIVGSVGLGIGIGYQNSNEMVAQDGTTGNAGTASRAYRGPNNLSDWYLPSKEELNELYSQKAIVEGLIEDWYWSSSEYGASPARFALLQNILNNNTFVSQKEYLGYVRAIRAF